MEMLRSASMAMTTDRSRSRYSSHKISFHRGMDDIGFEKDCEKFLLELQIEETVRASQTVTDGETSDRSQKEGGVIAENELAELGKKVDDLIKSVHHQADSITDFQNLLALEKQRISNASSLVMSSTATAMNQSEQLAALIANLKAFTSLDADITVVDKATASLVAVLRDFDVRAMKALQSTALMIPSISELRQEVVDLCEREAALEQLNRENSERMACLDLQEAELRLEGEALVELDEKYAQLCNQLEDINRRNAERQEQIAILDRETVERDSKLKELVMEGERIEEEVKEKESVLASALAELEEWKKQEENLRSAIAELKRAAKACQEEREKKQKSIEEETRKEIEALRIEKAEIDEQNKVLEKQIADVKLHLEKKQIFEEQRRLITERQKKLEDLKAEQLKLETEVAELKAEVEKEEKTNQELELNWREKREALAEQTSALKAEVENLRATIIEERKKTEEEERKLANKRAEFDKMTAKIASEKARLEALEAEQKRKDEEEKEKRRKEIAAKLEKEKIEKEKAAEVAKKRQAATLTKSKAEKKNEASSRTQGKTIFENSANLLAEGHQLAPTTRERHLAVKELDDSASKMDPHSVFSATQVPAPGKEASDNFAAAAPADPSKRKDHLPLWSLPCRSAIGAQPKVVNPRTGSAVRTEIQALRKAPVNADLEQDETRTAKMDETIMSTTFDPIAASTPRLTKSEGGGEKGTSQCIQEAVAPRSEGDGFRTEPAKPITGRSVINKRLVARKSSGSSKGKKNKKLKGKTAPEKPKQSTEKNIYSVYDLNDSDMDME